MLRSFPRQSQGLAILLSSLVTLAQTTPDTTIQVTTRIVYVDVVVRDSYGRIVRGLTEKDFRVLEDGKPQKIDYFHDHTHDTATTAVTAQPNADGSLNFSNVDPGGETASSINIILFDFFNTAPQDHLYAREQMIRFLEQLPPGRQTALFVLNTRLEMLQSFTGSTERLVAAAKEMKMATSSEETLGEQQQDVDQVNRMVAAMGSSASGAKGGGADSAAMQHMYETAVAQDAQRAADITKTALDQLGAAVSGYPGRKNLFWLSDRFPLYRGPTLEIHDLSSSMRANTMNLQDIADANHAEASAQIAIYPISLVGLEVGGAGPETASQPTGGELARQFSARAAMHEMLNNMADTTGGHAYYGTNDFEGALRRGFEDGSSYYTLAYRPENTNWNGQFRKIAVKMNEHGYSLAYRRGYYATPEEHAPSDSTEELKAALRPDTPEDTMLLLKSRVQLPDAKHRTVRVDSVIDPGNVDFSTDARGRKHARLLVTLVAIPVAEGYSDQRLPPDLPQTSGAYVVDLDPQAFQKLLADGMTVHQELRITPGAYRLRLGVSDMGNHRIGTLDMPVQINAEN